MKELELYDKNGWFNAEQVINYPSNFIFVTGARAIGKTYSSIKYLIEERIPFLYLRRTQNESDFQANEQTSSLTKVLQDLNCDYAFKKSGKIGYVEIYEDEQVVSVIYLAALSTFATIRGINLEIVKVILYDEFIPESHVRAIKNEGFALMNLYESINRNRGLEGKEEIKLIGLANALNIANDIFITFNLVMRAEKMIEELIESDYQDGVLLISCINSPVSGLKQHTALYQLATEEYSKMALENKFVLNDFSLIKPKINIKQLKIDHKVGDLSVYRFKGDKGKYYITFRSSETKDIYKATTADLIRYIYSVTGKRVIFHYLCGKVMFDSYKAQAVFEKYIKTKR